MRRLTHTSLADWALVLCIAGAVAEPIAQSPDRTRGQHGVMMGVVVDALTGDTVAGARVTRWLLDANDLTQYEVITDSDGRFVYRDVAPGLWRVTAQLGDRRGASGARRVHGPDRPVAIAAAAAVTGVTIELFPVFGFISGRVTDDLGEPLVDALVGALRPHPWLEASTGEPALSRYWQTTRTDDRGEYRLAVEPGRYIVHVPAALVSTRPIATPVDGAEADPESIERPVVTRGSYVVQVTDPDEREAATRGVMAPLVDPSGRLRVHQSAVVPAAPDGSPDRLIAISGGDVSAGHDIQLTLMDGVRISGAVVGPEGPLAGTRVQLTPTVVGTTPVLIDEPVATATTAGDGSFALDGVPAGRYALQVVQTDLGRRPISVTRSPAVASERGASVPAMGTRSTPAPVQQDGSALWATMDVNVGDQDIDELQVFAEPGATVSGHISFDTDGVPPPPARVARMSVYLDAERLMPPGLILRAAEDGRFTTAGYPPAQYLLRASLQGWVVKSVMSGGQDLSRDPFSLEGRSLENVEIVMTNRTASMTGRVASTESNHTDATVLIFAADYARWRRHASQPGRWKAVRVAGDGSFLATDLLAGEYFVVAVDDGDVPGWPNARALDRLVPLATTVTLGESATANVDLTVRVIR